MILSLLLAGMSLSSFAGIDDIDLFSANTRRETLSKNSPKAIGFVKIGGCTGFFVETSHATRSFVSSSRHCFEYDAPAWCKTGTAKIHSTGQQIKCLGVAAGDETHDTIMFEFQNISRDRSGDLSYSKTMPPKSTRLEMIGFPKDGYLTDSSLDTLITSHNCRVVNPGGTNIYTSVPEVIDDEVFLHDCSTYGGNSGGPMMIEGTLVVVGIPDQYRPGSTPTTDLDAGRNIQGVRVDAFVDDLQSDLLVAGIVLVDPVIPQIKNLSYFADGSFTDQSKKQVIKISETSFLSDTSLKSFTLNEVKVTCQLDKCTSRQPSMVILLVGVNQMKIDGKDFFRSSVE